MREIISRDNSPCLIFSNNGNVKQIKTGSDSCAEHSFPAKHLVPRLCAGGYIDPAGLAFHAINQGHLVQHVALPQTPGTEPEAVMGFNGPAGPWPLGNEQKPIDCRSVLSSLTGFRTDVASALAWGNFAIRVRGAHKVEALAKFHQAILEGDVAIVAGSNLNGNRHGVVLINLKELTSDELNMLEADPLSYLRAAFKA